MLRGGFILKEKIRRHGQCVVALLYPVTTVAVINNNVK